MTTFDLTPYFRVDLKNIPPHRHAYVERLVRSWYGMRKFRHLASWELVKRAIKRAKRDLP